MTKSNKNPSENPINGCGCISCILILSAVLLRIGYGLEGLGVSRGVVAGIFIVILIAYVIGIPIVVITFVVKAFKNNTISEEEESLVEESRKEDVEKFKKNNRLSIPILRYCFFRQTFERLQRIS